MRDIKKILFVLLVPVYGTVYAGENSWTSVSPPSVYPTGVSGAPQARAWYGGITYRPSNNSILFYDGFVGEGSPTSIYANALAMWELGNDRINVVSIKEDNPLSRHTYEVFDYVETEDAVYMMGGAHEGCMDPDADGLWKYRFADNTWTNIAPNISFADVPAFARCEAHMIYWEAGNRLIWKDISTNLVFEYDLGTSLWSKHAIDSDFNNETQIDRLYRSSSFWDPIRNLWVFWNKGELFAYNPANRTLYDLPELGSAPSATDRGVTYVSKYDVYLIAGGVDDVSTWMYKPADSRWTRLPDANFPAPDWTYIFYERNTDLVYALLSGDTRTFYTMKFVPEGIVSSDPPRDLIAE